jgi:hypothetical protein
MNGGSGRHGQINNFLNLLDHQFHFGKLDSMFNPLHTVPCRVLMLRAIWLAPRAGVPREEELNRC